MKLIKVLLALAVCFSVSATVSAQTLSAGETLLPNTNYADDEPAHNTRVPEPYKMLVPKLDPTAPVQLRPHSRLVLSDIEDRPFFDYFGWQTFIALVWPADQDKRGVPDTSVTPETFLNSNQTSAQGDSVPVVWESFQTFDTVFPGNGWTQDPPEQPEAWDTTPYQRPFPLALTSKHPVELDEASSSPLIDQNRQYVRYSLQLNKVMYEFIRQNKWYLKGNLPKSPTQASLPPLPVDNSNPPQIISVQQPQTNTIITQPVNGNSMEIKAAWRIMITEADSSKPWREVDDLSRYFVSEANVTDPVTGETSVQKVGLVGLHVVVKTPQFSQGLWSTFEHVDNVKAPSGVRASFNGTGEFYPQGFSYQPKPFTPNGADPVQDEADRTPVEVSRIYKIPETPVATSTAFPEGLSTQGMNKTYQKLLDVGSVGHWVTTSR